MPHVPSLEPYDQLSREARGCGLQRLRPSPAHVEHGLTLHRSSIVVDAFGFCPYVHPPDLVEQLQLAAQQGLDRGRLNDLLYELRQTACARFADCAESYFRAFDAAGVACHIQTAGSGEGVANTVRSLARFVSVCDQHDDRMCRATRGSDIVRARAEGRQAMVLSVNGPIIGVPDDAGERDLHWLRTFRQLGVRLMHLAYNLRNDVGDGCVEDEGGGLTEFGTEVVRYMQHLGIVVDLSHTGIRTGMDATNLATRPVVATHTACRALNMHDRCKPDEAMRAIADTGGFVGIAAIPPFLGRSGDIVALLDHIDHAVDAIGIDHVAIGSDLGANPSPPAEAEQLLADAPPTAGASGRARWKPDDPVRQPGAFDECRRSLAWTNWPLFTVGLVQRGYSDEQIGKILGGNVLRVLESACNDRPAAPIDAAGLAISQSISSH